jgi:predicted transcriptional regulator
MGEETGLSRRERQIMDVIYARQGATAAQVREGIDDPPGYSAIRALLRILEEKGHLKHQAVKGKYIYFPARPRAQAARKALRGILKTFFENSAAKAVAALLSASDARLTDEQLAEISRLIDQARTKGNKS